MNRRSIFLLALSMCALLACPPVTDLGATCRLVKKDPSDLEGKRSIPMVEGEIKPGRDFISFGAVECDDLTCVRDTDFVKADGTTDTDPALGYCSRPCLQTNANACPAQNPADDTSALKRLNCRALILDEATLNYICQTEPATCKKYFGETKSPYFCARGGTTDAGT